MRSIGVFVVLAVLVSLLAGCPGKVEFSELDKFGAVKSAVWLELTMKDPDGEWTTNVLVVNSKPGLCKAYQQALPEMATYNEQIYDLWYDYWYDYDYYYDYPDFSEVCALYEGFYTHLADSFDKFYGPGSNSMTFYLMEIDGQGDSEWDVPPEDGIYDAVGDWSEMDTGRYFDLAVNRYNANPFRIYSERYAGESEYGCFYFYDYDLYDELDDAIDMYWLSESDGTASLTMKGDKKVKVEFSAGISDEDQDSAGTVDGSFTATHCPVTIESDNYFYLYFYSF